MKRGNGPQRRTPLAPGGPIKRTAPLKSGGNRLEASAPIKRDGGSKKPGPAWKPSRPASVPKAVKGLLKERSGGACEVGLVCGGRAEGADPAHREGKKAGGTRKPWSNSPSNLLWSCRPCHDLIDQKQPAKAEKLGLKVREGVARPWEIPVLHERFRWVLLDDQGGWRVAPAGSHPKGERPIPVVVCTAWELIRQDGPFIEAMSRYKHLQCPGWSAPREGLFTCGCGSAPFFIEEVAS